MKTLILVRHAKSDHNGDLPDYDRPLNEKGHGDARKMAKYLKEKGVEIDAFISSPAKRALTTCRYFAETFGNGNIQKKEDLYEPLEEDFVKTILGVPDECRSVAVFSHNPTISEFASATAGELVHFPTCGVAIFEIDADQWSLFESAKTRLVNVFEPGEI